MTKIDLTDLLTDPLKTAAGLSARSSLQSSTSIIYKNSWYADSGASDHITGEISHFTQYKQLSRPIPIVMGNNSIVYATHSGTMLLPLPSTDLRLYNVLYAPDLGCDLLSIELPNPRAKRISSRTIQRNIIKEYQGGIRKLIQQHKSTNARFSLTLSGWTASSSTPYRALPRI